MTTVDTIVKSQDRDLLVLALTLAVVIALVAIFDTILKTIKDGSALFDGPVKMGLYVMDTALTVLIHFLSTTLGRWALTIGPSNLNVIDMTPMFVATISLLWLLGKSTGTVASG